MPGKCVTRADVVRELGSLTGGPRLTPKRAAAVGGALQAVFPQLSESAAASLASHAYRSMRDGMDLDETLDAVQRTFPALAVPGEAPRAPPRDLAELTQMDVNREDFPPFARPGPGDLPPEGSEPVSYAGGQCEPAAAKRARGGGKRDRGYARAATGGGRDGGFGRAARPDTGGHYISMRRALTGAPR